MATWAHMVEKGFISVCHPISMPYLQLHLPLSQARSVSLFLCLFCLMSLLAR